MPQITANDLKTKGIAAVEAVLHDHSEAIVSVRGHAKFAIMDINYYNYLRECELESAIAESRADIKAGRFIDESAQSHINRLLTEPS